MSETPWAVAAAGLLATVPRVTGSADRRQERSSLDIDQGAFLQLLLAQMRNQDPLSPMQGEEFMSQLAQLTTLEQMQASAMIGRTVQAIDETGQVIEGIVQGARVRGGVVSLDLGDREILLEQITSVR